MEKSLVYGGKCAELFASFDRESLSLKTAQYCLFEDYQRSLDHLPRSGMMQNGQLFELRGLDLPKDEIDVISLGIPAECLTIDRLLPTPTKSGAEHRTRYAQGGRPLMHMIIQGYPNIGKSAKLRPQFVEWIMGYPEDHTEKNE